ncbi:MAG: substrate-binding domain-containing protein, partial [Pseudobutyrivibrio sp.]|nr:substrate-binding domain-containing protein [Pseudobutyrivibrio sp.]
MKKRIERVSVGILFICLLTISACRGADFHSTKSLERKTYKFGATYMQMNNPYFQDMNAHLEELVEVNGDVLICRDPSQDQEKQNQQIEEMIDEGVDGIFLNPVNYETVKP